MKAILFSNFPQEVFTNTLKPKFDQAGVEIVRVANIDRSSNIEPGEADVVVAMVELMSSGQKERVKSLAKKHDKKFVSLSRKGPWDQFAKIQATLDKKGPILPPAPSAPPPSKTWTPVIVPPPPPSEPVVEEEESPTSLQPSIDPEEIGELLSMFEQENERLEEQLKIVQDRYNEKDYEAQGLRNNLDKVKSERDQQISELRKAKRKLEDLAATTVSKESYNKLSEQYAAVTAAKKGNSEQEAALKRQVAEVNARLAVVQREGNEAKSALDALTAKYAEDAKAAHAFIENAKREVLAYKTANDNLAKEVSDASKVVEKQGSELFRLKQENEQLRKNPAPVVDDAEVKKLRSENETLKQKVAHKATVKSTEDFLKVREAFATLWRAGAMTDKDILEKLMNWQPKE